MAERVHRLLGMMLWRGLMVVVVLLAVYVTGTRALLRELPGFAPRIVAELSRMTDSTIRVQSMAGRLQGFSPEIEVTGLALRPPLAEADVLTLERATMRLDIWSSLLALAPRFDAIELNEPMIEWFFNDQIIARADGTDEASGIQFEDFSDLLQAFSRVSVNNGALLLTRITPDGSQISVPMLAQIDLERLGSERRVRARLTGPDGLLMTVAGQGVGNPFSARDSRGELHGTLAADNLGEVGQLFDLDLSGAGNIDFWYQPQGGQPSWRIVAALDAPGIRTPEHEYSAESANMNVAVERDDAGWQLYLQDIALAQPGTEIKIPRLQISQEIEGWLLRTGDIDVSAAVSVLRGSGFTQGKLDAALETLAPSGALEHLEVRVEPGVSFEAGWWVRAGFRDATTLPFRGVPGLYGIDTFIEASADGATAWIDTSEFGLDLPKVYNDVITLDTVRGKLSATWQRDALFLQGGQLSATSAEYEATAQFGMDIPFKKGEGPPLAMYLTVGVPGADVAIRRRFVPKTLKPTLYNWLEQAIPGGQLSATTFVWRGGFKPWDGPAQTMQLALGLSDAAVAFEPSWPPVNELAGTLFMDDGRIGVWSERTLMQAVVGRDTSVEVDASRAGTRLVARTRVGAEIEDTLALLASTPIGDRAEPLLDDLTGSGRIEGDLLLGMDVGRIQESLTLDLDTQVTGGVLNSAVLGISASEVTGQLGYQHGRGFSSRDGLRGMALGTELSVEIDPERAGPGTNSVFAGRFSATPSIAALNEWLSPPVVLPFAGETTVHVDVVAAEQTRIGIHSDLQGLSLDLPAPVGKPAEATTPLVIDFALDGDSPVDVFWEDRVSGQLYRLGAEIVGGSFDLTSRKAFRPPPEPSITSGYYVMGNLGRIEIDQWIPALGQMTYPQDLVGERLDLDIEALQVEELVLGDSSLGKVTIDLMPFVGWEMLGLNADWLDAEVLLQHDGKANTLVVNTLDLDRLPDFMAGDAKGGSGSPQALSPPDLSAPVNVVIANLIHRGSPLGAASFSLDSDGEELRLTDIRGHLADAEFVSDSSFTWTTAGGENASRLRLNSRFEDVGDTLDMIGSARILETRRGSLEAELGWDDTPFSPSLAGLSGNLSLALEEGSFLPVSGQATGALRILSVLNLAGLVRRANVNQLFKPGVAFDEAGGDLQFGGGFLSIPDFEIDGSGGSFVLNSDIDLLSETIDGELVVTLPLVGNIPWVAAIAGGLPIAAGAYIISRVFEDQVNSLSSGVYSVSGQLSAPEVKFVRIFDAETKAPESRVEAAVPPE